MTTCYFCNHPIQETDNVENHHPHKAKLPKWTEPAHKDCHRLYHSIRGDFDQLPDWCKGRAGYELTIAKWPTFHRMGGLARARTAKRDEKGRFKCQRLNPASSSS